MIHPAVATRTLPLLLLFSLSLPPGLAAAEGYVLRGTVRDESRNTLPGVRVAVPGVPARVFSDDEGRFVVNAPRAPAGRLVFSKPGYAEKHLDPPAGAEPIEVTMARNQNDAGLHRFSTRISPSHSLTTVRDREPALLRRPLDSEAYRGFVTRHGEMAPEEVAVRTYLPANASRVLAVFLISEHGIGGPMMEHPLLRQFADRHGIALVGVLGDPIQRGIYPAAALDTLLAAVGKEVGHPELAQAPFLTFGHSNGSGFSVLQAALQPDKTLGWISYQSGGSWQLVFPDVEKSPGMVMHGQLDRLFTDQDRIVAGLRRDRHAPVSLLVAGDAAHWPADRPRMYELVISFAEACLRVRAPRGLAQHPALAPVRIEEGWLGGQYDRARGGMQAPTIAPFRTYSGDVSTANWLPDEAFARAWRQFSSTGSVAGH